MKTQISEIDRHEIDRRLQKWIAAVEEQEEQLEAIALALGIDHNTALDLLNTCGNSRAVLDSLGIEVYDDGRQVADPYLENEGWQPVAFDQQFCAAMVIGIVLLCGVAVWIL